LSLLRAIISTFVLKTWQHLSIFAQSIAMQKRTLLSGQKLQITIKRLCHQLIENHIDFNNTVLIGIQPRGTFFADRVHQELSDILKTNTIKKGHLDITFFRDDFRRKDGLVTASSNTIDFIIEGIEEYMGVTIVSAKNEEIRSMIIHDMGRGVTLYKGERGYGKSGEKGDVNIIYTVITRLEVAKLKTEIEKIDPAAFVVMNSIKDKKGGMIKKRALH